jgi:uncharacterized protein YjeT (DUF2065 family)|tara:strand:+ start:468 stop:653 length:186 start_codon:yes stop_codon:yes gene_type:complete
MSDLITALGLLFFIEGLLLAMFPSRIKNMLKVIETMSTNKIRNSGIFFLVIGFGIIWYMRH